MTAERVNPTRSVVLLGVFAKHWQPGTVKTRLAATIGDCWAAELYRRFLAVLLGRMRGVADRRILAFTPATAREPFEKLAGRAWTLQPQAGGDLGDRMHQYFASALASGANRVVLIGSDSPTLPVLYLREAFAALKTHPVVLGPTDDGGYYLVGARDCVPPIFASVDWSGASVWEQTIGLLQRANCAYAQLPTWYDVDDFDDLLRLRDELADLSGEDDRWHGLSTAVEDVCAEIGSR